MSNLFSIYRCDFFPPLTSWFLFFFKSICFLFLAMCSFHFNLQSKCIRSYFTTSVCGMIVSLMLTAGQWTFRRLNVMCHDVDSLTLIFPFFSHYSIMCKYYMVRFSDFLNTQSRIIQYWTMTFAKYLRKTSV